jgi:hypothetical protein
MTTPDGSRPNGSEPTTAIFLDDRQEAAPIFVDDSGTRRRRFRMVGVGATGLCACFLALAVMAVVGHGPFEGIRLPGLSPTARSARHPARPAAPARHAPATTVGGRNAATSGIRNATTPTAVPQGSVTTPTSGPGAARGKPASSPPSTVTAPVTPTPTTAANRGHTTIAPGPSKSRGNGLLNGHGPTTSPTTVPHGNAKSAA